MNGMRILLCALAGAAILSGCSGAGEGSQRAERSPSVKEGLRKMASVPSEAASSAKPADIAQDEAAGTGSGAPAGSLANLPGQRMVIKTATLGVRVRDVPSAFQRAVQLAEGSGGYVQTSTESEEGGEQADLTIRVPPQGFLPLVASLGALGTVTTKTITGEDVTQEYFDLGAELDNQQEVRGRLLQLLKQAPKVKDAIAVEEQLERVGANLNRIKGRMKYLETMSGMCTVTVSLYGEARAVREGFLSWSLVGHGFWRAAQILVSVFFVLLQVLVVAIPLVVVMGAAAWGIVLLVRAIRRRKDWLQGLSRPRELPGQRSDESRGAVKSGNRGRAAGRKNPT
jgi:hypothetical protein